MSIRYERLSQADLDRAAAAALGASAGSTRVQSARSEMRYDEDGVPYVLLLLELEPPPRGRDTWPVDELYEVNQAVQSRVEGLSLPLDVRLTLSGGADTDEEEPEEDGGLGAALGSLPPEE